MEGKQTKTSEPTLGVVIPLYKHSVLVHEALQSILDQQFEGEIVVAIVNDGCPHRESDEVSRLYADVYPNKIFYVKKINGGLSSARNTGIDYLLQKFESIRAIYLMDADNSISPLTLQRVWDALKQQDESVGWAYPDIDMFGTDYSLDTGGEFSVLRLLFQNYCEAGSMIRREVFESGARYDEEMLLGYEDWEFWYQAIDKGYKGIHIPYFGFCYRKRPESMLANSTRDDQQIRGYMRRKHKELFSQKNLLKLEEEEAPRYCTILDTHECYYYLDPSKIKKGKICNQEYFFDFFKAIADPYYYHTPPIRTFASSNAWNVLEENRLLHWLHWYIDDIFQNFSGFITVKIVEADKNELSISLRENIGKYTEIADSDIICCNESLLTNIVKDEFDYWFMTLYSNQIEPSVKCLEIHIPGVISSPGMTMELLRYYVLNHRIQYKSMSEKYMDTTSKWKSRDLIGRKFLNTIPRELTGFPSCYPLISDKTKIGFLLPLSSFGGVEKVTHNLAKELKRKGYSTHLFILNADSYTLIDSFRDAYESINFLDDDQIGHWTDEKTFFGAGITTWHNLYDRQQRALGLLSAMDIVVNQHSIDALAITGMMKRIGIKTVDYLHLLDKTPLGEDTGHPLVGIAYEHGFDYFVAISDKLKNLLHGMGVPEEKIVVIPNAPSYEIEREKLERLRKEKLNRENEKLHILFIGRLDRQKGLDRLEKIYAMTKAMNVEWKIVGKSVLESGENCEICQRALPPVYDDEALTELYQWADCIVMPSYNEGVPLVMLEAMRLGAVPICTDVGAIDEVIEHRRDGYLVPNENRSVVLSIKEILGKLSGNSILLKKVQRNAINKSDEFSWQKSTEVFIERIIQG